MTIKTRYQMKQRVTTKSGNTGKIIQITISLQMDSKMIITYLIQNSDKTFGCNEDEILRVVK